MTHQELFDQLCFYTMNHRDPRFIHQHAVDAFAVQEATEHSKPITIVFGLAGLYLYLEKGFTGRQVQRAHMQMAKRQRTWPQLTLPPERGTITIADVVRAEPGETLDRAIHDWCVAVWSACQANHEEIARLLNTLLDIA
jgi:hypothetical protein